MRKELEDRIDFIIKNQSVPNWSIQDPWNKSLELSWEREFKPRDILYVGNIGAPFIEVYWSMMGVPPTNKISSTIKRKMEAGNLYESIVVWTLKKLNLLVETQGKSRLLNEPDYLSVYGRYDILSGHSENWELDKEKVHKYFEKLREKGFEFPFLDKVERISLTTIDYLSKKYPDGNLFPKIYEVKSLNSLAFWRNDEMISEPYKHHVRQLTWYQLFNEQNVINGSFLYIDRDTMSISEIPNIIRKEVVNEMFEWLEKMTYYYRNKIEPPKPEIIIWDIRDKKYTINWEILRSDYRDKLLEGVDLDKVEKEVIKKNKELKERELMKSAFKGEDKHGNKKYKLAIDLILQGMSSDEVSKRTGVPIHALDYYFEKLLQKDV
jgi:hypothetical protein